MKFLKQTQFLLQNAMFCYKSLQMCMRLQFLDILMKLYSPSNNYKLDKVLFGSRILGKPIEHIAVPFDHKNKQFIAQYPNYSLPALQVADSSYVFGANSILLSIFGEKMNALQVFEQAQIYQWLELAEKQLENSTGVMVVHQQKIGDISQEQLGKAKDQILKVMKIADQRLKLRTYLVSNSISPADIVLFFNFRALKDPLQKQIKNLTNLKRWIANLQFIWAQLSQK